MRLDGVFDECIHELIELCGRKAGVEAALHAEPHLTKLTEVVLLADAFSHANDWLRSQTLRSAQIENL
jgi:hypothetical protein